MSHNNVLDIPRFASEKEEATWWDDNPDFLLRELEQAEAEGRLGHGTLARRAAALEAAKVPTVQVDPNDIPLLNKLAERKGMEREDFLKALLHEALLREEAAGPSVESSAA